MAAGRLATPPRLRKSGDESVVPPSVLGLVERQRAERKAGDRTPLQYSIVVDRTKVAELDCPRPAWERDI